MIPEISEKVRLAIKRQQLARNMKKIQKNGNFFSIFLSFLVTLQNILRPIKGQGIRTIKKIAVFFFFLFFFMFVANCCLVMASLTFSLISGIILVFFLVLGMILIPSE